MSAGAWLVVWVFGMAALGLANGGILRAIQGAFMGLVLWCFFGFFAFLWGAMSVNECREYGHPSLADTSNGETCSDADIEWHVENR